MNVTLSFLFHPAANYFGQLGEVFVIIIVSYEALFL